MMLIGIIIAGLYMGFWALVIWGANLEPEKQEGG
jgi:hypothetical protein